MLATKGSLWDLVGKVDAAYSPVTWQGLSVHSGKSTFLRTNTCTHMLSPYTHKHLKTSESVNISMFCSSTRPQLLTPYDGNLAAKPREVVLLLSFLSLRVIRVHQLYLCTLCSGSGKLLLCSWDIYLSVPTPMFPCPEILVSKPAACWIPALWVQRLLSALPSKINI